jgi:hypothetical protein
MPAAEVGWRLGRPFWRCGLATEAARAALRFGLIDRGLQRIVSIAQVGNNASERIMDKLGMQLERETIDPTRDRLVRSTPSPRRSTYLRAQAVAKITEGQQQRRRWHGRRLGRARRAECRRHNRHDDRKDMLYASASLTSAASTSGKSPVIAGPSCGPTWSAAGPVISVR